MLAVLLLGSAYAVPAQSAHAHTDGPLDDQNCTLILPPSPLTATGLSTPFQLTNTDTGLTCDETNAAQSAFVQAVIFDTQHNTFSVYEPLVVNKSNPTPAVAPIVPTLPAHAIVALWFGFNANNLTLADTDAGATLAGANCINGIPGSVFGQFAYCNAVAFFKATNAAINNGNLHVPALGTANDGQPCPTVRDFFVVDQDPSDNVQTQYLANNATGQTAQNNAANAAAFAGSSVIGNPSDNALVSKILDPALGCKPWTAPDLAAPGKQTPALPLDELQARQFQRTPVAQIPNGDPMVLVNGTTYDLAKTNAYRAGVDQRILTDIDDADTARYCREMLRIQPARLMLDQAKLNAIPSPAPIATTLFNFLLTRFSGSYALLNCADLLNLPDPTKLTVDGGGVTTAASFDPAILQHDLQTIRPLQERDFNADAAHVGDDQGQDN
jgi:hypothetical protein